MTKKDYQLIADSINCSMQLRYHADRQDSYRTFKHVVEDLAQNLAKDNSRFDTKKFLTACGIVD